MSQKFAWLPVKDADLATLKRELCVAPEYEDKTVAKFQKFCTDNDFDQFSAKLSTAPGFGSVTRRWRFWGPGRNAVVLADPWGGCLPSGRRSFWANWQK